MKMMTHIIFLNNNSNKEGCSSNNHIINNLSI